MRRVTRGLAIAGLTTVRWALEGVIRVLDTVCPAFTDDAIAAASTDFYADFSDPVPPGLVDRSRALVRTATVTSFADARLRTVGPVADQVLWEAELANFAVCEDCSRCFHPGDEGCTHQWPPLCGDCAQLCTDCIDDHARDFDDRK